MSNPALQEVLCKGFWYHLEQLGTPVCLATLAYLMFLALQTERKNNKEKYATIKALQYNFNIT